MSDLFQWIKQQIVADLQIGQADLRILSRPATGDAEQAVLVGDEIEFDIVIKNDNAFPLTGLEVNMHQVEAVEFEESPVVGHIAKLTSGEQVKAATIKGVVRSDPDDAKSAWRTLDYVCRVTVTGKIDLPPIKFHDEEFEVRHIKNA
jgi:hypothetical protein